MKTVRAFVVALPALVLAGCTAPETVAYQTQSALGPIYVIDQGDQRHLRIGARNAPDQTIISLTNPEQVPTEYVRHAFLSFALAKEVKRVLMIGLGGGAFTTRLRQSTREVRVDVVEISPEIVDIAKRYFGVAEDPRFRIYIANGRDFVGQTSNRYDVVFIDAYTGKGVPAEIATAEFFADVARRLTAGGVAALNIALNPKAERKLIASFAGEFLYVACLSGARDGNLLLFGMTAPPLEPAALRRRVDEMVEEMRLPFSLGNAAGRLNMGCKDREPARAAVGPPAIAAAPISVKWARSAPFPPKRNWSELRHALLDDDV